jgi:hypothetical protein
MATFRFLHCADLHLDSPLRGLEADPDAPVEAVRGAGHLMAAAVPRVSPRSHDAPNVHAANHDRMNHGRRWVYPGSDESSCTRTSGQTR